MPSSYLYLYRRCLCGHVRMMHTARGDCEGVLTMLDNEYGGPGDCHCHQFVDADPLPEAFIEASKKLGAATFARIEANTLAQDEWAH